MFFGDPLVRSKVARVIEMNIGDEIDDFLAFKNQHYGSEVMWEYSRVNELVNEDKRLAFDLAKEYADDRPGLARLDVPTHIKGMAFDVINHGSPFHTVDPTRSRFVDIYLNRVLKERLAKTDEMLAGLQNSNRLSNEQLDEIIDANVTVNRPELGSQL